MKKINLLLFVSIIISISAFSQQYRTAADTVKLNKEYLSVTNSISELTSKLAIAQNNLPGYVKRADNAASNASDMAMTSSEQSSKAAGGDLRDAKKAKRKAKQALHEAKHAKAENRKVGAEEKYIERLKNELQKKQERLQELETMRANINNQQK